MRRVRLVAALTGLITALLLQATVVAPVTAPYPVSLPAVLVAVVALLEGPAAGMSLGFSVGLVADLGSHHPAGVLALCWLGLGLVAGLLADRNAWLRDTLSVGVLCGLASCAAAVLLVVLDRGAPTLREAIVHTPAAIVGDIVLSVLLFVPVRRMLRSPTLRLPRQVEAHVLAGARSE